MWRIPFLAAAAVLSAMPAYAADRFYCAVDDSNIKLSLDVGFEADGAHKLNHFRGALIAKQDAIPVSFRRLMLDSSQLVHHWGYGDDLRLDVYGEGEDADAGKSFDLIVMANPKAKGSPLAGTYILTFEASQTATPLQFKGPLSCSEK